MRYRALICCASKPAPRGVDKWSSRLERLTGSSSAASIGITPPRRARSTAHGALSVENGHLEVWWDAHDRDDEMELRLHWRERGVLIAHEPARSGYGSEILQRSIPHMLHGGFERTFHPDG